jgi:signal recognition particle subunit SRP54
MGKKGLMRGGLGALLGGRGGATPPAPGLGGPGLPPGFPPAGGGGFPGLPGGLSGLGRKK